MFVASTKQQKALILALDALDKTRAKQAFLKDREARQEAVAIASMRSLRVDKVVLRGDRQASLVAPNKTTVDAEAFRSAALASGAEYDAIEKCVSASVQIDKARKLIGAQKLKQISTVTPGKPHVRITGKR